jgi:hypothetical protein
MTYKITKKIRSLKNDFENVNENDLYNYIKTNPIAYEALIDGSYIPYYEFDYKYDTEEDQKTSYTDDVAISYGNVRSEFDKDATIYSFDASGYDPIKKCWKNSFHYRIRGNGYYLNALEIPQVEGMDTSVYKRKNSRQLMRLPFCTKEGNNRPLLRFNPQTYKSYTIDTICELKEKVDDYIIQNIQGEVQILNKKEQVKVEKNKAKEQLKVEKKTELCKIEDIKDRKKNDEIEKKDIIQMKKDNKIISELTLEYVQKVCSCLNESRFNDRINWLKFIRCLKNIRNSYDIDTLSIAHEYSKKSSKYNTEEIDLFFQRTSDESPDLKINIGSLCYWASIDTPTIYTEILNLNEKQKNTRIQGLIKKASESLREFSFSDYTLFVNKKFDNEYRVIKYFVDTIIHVIDGGNHKIFTRNVMTDGSTKYNSILQPQLLFKTVNDFTLIINKEQVIFSELYNNLFYHNKCYKFIDYVPYLEKNPMSKCVFNLFQGFQYTFKRMDTNIRPTELDTIFYHIKEIICDNDPNVFEYMMNYISHMFQHPDEKPGVAILIQSSEQGTGKNRFTDFLMNVIGVDNTHKANKIEDICSKFNYHLQGKLLVVGDEIANYQSHKFADILKAIITEVHRSIEPKGRDSYIIQCYLRLILTSNNDFPYRDPGRRLLALKVSSKKKGDLVYFNKLSNDIDNKTIQELFFNYMASRDISKWSFRTIPQTQMKTDLTFESFDNSIHYLIEHMNKSELETQILSAKFIYSEYKTYCDDNGFKAIHSRKFYKDIESMNITKKRIMKDGTRDYYYKINRNKLELKIQEDTNDKTFKFENNKNDEPYDSDDEE